MCHSEKQKKLLIIGHGGIDKELVETSKKMGLYTICASGIPTSEKTPAKIMADEAWDMDYFFTEELAEKAMAAGVGGVIAGYGEFRVMAAIRLAEKLKMPCYTTEAVMDITRDKVLFKEACRRYNVKVPDYVCFDHMPKKEQLDSLSFPVIVKPTDAGGRNGISICNLPEELVPALQKAFASSVEKKVIVEQFLRGTEFSARYFISDGVPKLCSLKDKYLLEDEPTARLLCFEKYPSDVLDRYIREADPFVRQMMQGSGMQFGTAAFQGIYNGDGFFFFETNYRIGGGNDQRILQHECGFNYIEAMIEHALTGNTHFDMTKVDPHFSHCCAHMRTYAKAGTITEMKYPTAGEIDNLISVITYKTPGTTVTRDKTTGQQAFSFFFSADDTIQLKKAVDETQERLVIKGENGNSMLYRPFRTELLFG